jgi:hypothetical protein
MPRGFFTFYLPRVPLRRIVLLAGGPAGRWTGALAAPPDSDSSPLAAGSLLPALRYCSNIFAASGVTVGFFAFLPFVLDIVFISLLESC